MDAASCTEIANREQIQKGWLSEVRVFVLIKWLVAPKHHSRVLPAVLDF